MARVNKTRYALLGVLSMGPASGYDIKITMAQSTDHFWKEGDASIYPILKQLLKEKLVTMKVANAESGKPKKIYALTKTGKLALQHWLEKNPEAVPSRNELLLKIFFGWNADPKIIISHLSQFRPQIENNLNQYRSSKLAKKAASQNLSEAELYRFLTLKAGIAYSEASLAWCDDALSLLLSHQKSRKIS